MVTDSTSPSKGGKRRRRTRRSNKASKAKHQMVAINNQTTYYYSPYRGFGGGHPPLFTKMSHAVAWGISRASRDGTLRAANLAHGEDYCARSLENIRLDFVGIVNLLQDEVESNPFVTNSEVEKIIFSMVAFHSHNSARMHKVTSSYIRVGRDVIQAVLDSFHKKMDFHHSAGSLYGKGQCPSLNSIAWQKTHCPAMSSSFDSLGFLHTDSKALKYKDKKNKYQSNGETMYYILLLFLFMLRFI